MVTSSAVVGSSAISTLGDSDSAIAIITRWRIPPENSCGYARARSRARGIPTRSIRLTARSIASALEIFSWARICSTIWSPIRCTGLSDEIGSWKIIAISLPRICSSCSSLAVTSSRPPSFAEPSKRAFGDRVSPISVITVTDFPDPDSPTIATTSPRSSVNDTPSTARTRPSSVTNETCRSSTSSRRSPISRAGEPDPRIDQRVQDVGERSEQNDEERREHRAHEDRRDVEVADRLRLVLTDARKVEDRLGDERGTANRVAKSSPNIVMIGISELRRTWALNTLRCGRPLAFAVRTKSWLTMSSRFERRTRE